MKYIIDKLYNQPLRRLFYREARIFDGHQYDGCWEGPQWLLRHLASVQQWIIK